MLFNSIDFAIFLPIVFAVYWFCVNRNLKVQNFLIVVASYYFYGCWNWKFLALIVFSTLLDYSIGITLGKEQNKKKRKLLLWLSIIINLGFLGLFKYFNFFIDNFKTVFSFFGHNIDSLAIDIILPVGISFYTFQTLSYTIDVYRGNLKPTKDFIAFAAFVSFFPQLVAGPIERATNLLPQFYKERKFNYKEAVTGLRQILWGLFKKVVIADNCAQYANLIFNDYSNQSGSTLLLGAIFFTFQIYGDFSGYSDIAIGTSRLFGFRLMKNFSFPYFSRDIAEFWRRWHISLSTWFRDYVYIPLGGSRGGSFNKIKNTFIIFLISGLWHGANWTFIIWGLLNALYFLPLLLAKKNRNNMNIVASNTILPSFKELLQILGTFGLTVIAWIVFRSPSVKTALDYIYGIFSRNLLTVPSELPLYLFILLLFFLVIEWLERRQEFPLEKLATNWHPVFRQLFYYFFIFLIFWFAGEEQEFIYFQF